MELTDLELVERVQSGDVEAFAVLVTRHQHRVYSHVSRMVGQGEEAADLTQEVFLKVYTSLNRFRGQASFQTWLYRITSNLCVDRHRRQRRGPQVVRSTDAPVETELGELELELPDWDENPELMSLSGELRVKVREAVRQLSDKLRAVIVMHDLEGLSYEEIAAALNIPLGTVKSRLFNARAALKVLLEPYIQGGPAALREDERT
ncbi:MAG: sigma-70 family RNA polymerase sigma factor [Armatimonadetes bacterium]|nr:sigma-70 family RNA polymerase sigma factor [Armatimonadota bacterium]